MNTEVSKTLSNALNFLISNGGKLDRSSTLKYDSLVSGFYTGNDFKRVWSHNEILEPITDSLIQFISQSENYGLYPSDYHFDKLKHLQSEIRTDSSVRMDAMMWTRLELLSTDAFFHILKDLKEGRIIPDSLSIINKPKYRDSFFIQSLNLTIQKHLLTPVFNSAEPSFFKYQKLRELLPEFVATMDHTNFPQILFPFQDSLFFVEQVYSRISEKAADETGETIPDSTTFVAAVKRFQKRMGLKADGKAGPATVKELNNTDVQKFRSIAISLDRYKMLHSIPETFIWVNIPSYHLQVFEQDSLILTSKIIVGKPATPTPVLSSNINNMIVYPSWTIPASIIKKEILPALKRDTSYLSKKGYNLFNEKGEIINPYGINWTRYSAGIPWRVVQGSGDDNALGVFKFNFSNPYSVYLHDTNQRYLFANTERAISHGCVRVQKWQQLAKIITIRDSALSDPARLNYSEDSIKTWVATGVRKSINVRNKFPLFIVYFTCEAVDNGIQFYPDIYNDDAGLYNQYFARESN